MSSETTIRYGSQDLFVQYSIEDHGIGLYQYGDGHYNDVRKEIVILSCVDEQGNPVAVDESIEQLVEESLNVEPVDERI